MSETSAKALPHNTENRIKFPDGLRALAALFVLFSHIWYQIWPAVVPPFGYGQRPTGLMLRVTSWLYYGHFAVVVFIVLSGFCLMLPVVQSNGVLRGGTLQFFKRRARRILPPYYFALFLSILLIKLVIDGRTGSQWDISLPITIEGLIAHLLMLQDIVTPTQINYVFWSIALEFHLYLLFPILVIMCRYFGCIKTTLLSGIIVYSIIGILEIMHLKEIPPQFIGLCFYFTIGMLSTSIAFAKSGFLLLLQKYFPWIFLCIFSIVSIIYLCYAWGFNLAEERFAFLDTLCALGTLSLMIIASRQGENKLRDLLSSTTLVSIGTFSYSIYLIHAPLLQVIWQYAVHPFQLEKNQEFVILTLLSFPLIIIFAYTFYLYCERPFLNSYIKVILTKNR